MSSSLFTYGSLINAYRRPVNPTSSNAIPVRVSGLRRGWYVPVFEDKDTGLGVIPDSNSSCNGVLLSCDTNDLTLTDEREKPHGYERITIPKSNITLVSDQHAEYGNSWIYVVKDKSLPTSECPIAQSYVDVVIEGCLNIGREFAIEFVQSTDGWDYPWINDRFLDKKDRRYRRTKAIDKSLANEIDSILKTVVPTQLERRIDIVKEVSF